MKKVYKMRFDCGRRTAPLKGLFIADSEHIDYLLKSKMKIYFGEVSGKHSEVVGSIDEEEIIVVTDDPKVISIIEEFNLETGFNPLDYTINYWEDEENYGDEYADLTAREIITRKLGK